MTSARPKVLYVAAQLPKRSETFVYRELFGLRAEGWQVGALSLRAPERDLGDAALDQLAGEALVFYRGAGSLVAGAVRELFRHPLRTLRTLASAARLALRSGDIRGAHRLKVLPQALGVLAAAAELRRSGVGHVHAHMAHAPASVAMLLSRHLDVPFSFTGHAVDIFSRRTLLLTKLQRAAFCACISEWHRSFYQDELAAAGCERLDGARLPVVRCGVDLGEFAPTGRVAGPKLRILTVGRLIEKKGFDLLLRALAGLPADLPDLECLIMGGGDDADALAALCAELGLEDRVTFAGAVPNHAVRDQLRDADLFVLPCRVARSGDRDGIPVVLMEAMASGVPVIAGDIPSIRELVRDGASGLLVAPGAVDPLVDAVARLASDASLRAELAAGGRARVEEEFSLRRNVARIARSIGEAHGLAPAES